MKKHPLLRTALLVMTAAALLCVSALAVEDGAPANSMYGTFWALVPPVTATTAPASAVSTGRNFAPEYSRS